MFNKKKNKIVQGFILFILLLFITSHYKATDIKLFNYQDQKNFTNVKRAGYWKNVSPIYINNNWSNAVSQDWCSGNGSLNNPYLLENIKINAINSSTGSGIYINNSRDTYFIIRNCTVYNSKSGVLYGGITLNNTHNGTLINNNCSNNLGHGILLFNNCIHNFIVNNVVKFNSYCGIKLESHCSENIIIENKASANDLNGIELVDESNNNLISDNKVNSNQYNGIKLFNKCFNNSISKNEAKHNDEHGIGLHKECDNNTISNNLAYYNWDQGIEINYHCDNNTIAGNEIFDNYIAIYLLNNCSNNIIHGNDVKYIGSIRFQNYGIFLKTDCDNNIISGNLIENNYNYGILVLWNDCESNIIYQNSLVGNGWSTTGSQAGDAGTNTQWDFSGIGNYWDNFTSSDLDHDGVLDTYYTWIKGIANSQDRFPLLQSPVFKGDTIHINDDGLNAVDWETTEKLNLWCSGSGTFSDPYLLEGLDINASDSESCIFIENSNAYFIIQNCQVYNSGTKADDAGIKLENTTNGLITYVNFSSHKRNGILLINHCENNTISRNIGGESHRGIKLEMYCCNNTIKDNLAEVILSGGISLETVCDNNNISGNVGFGIRLDDYCEHNVILNNKVASGSISVLSSANQISENIASDSIGYGIKVNGDNNIITHNTANNNERDGLDVSGENNAISWNELHQNNAGLVLHSYSQNSTIFGNNISHNRYGMVLYGDNSCVIRNNISHNQVYGMEIVGINSNISENLIENNKYGIFSDNNQNFEHSEIVDNSLNYNEIGIYLGAYGFYKYKNYVKFHKIINNTLEFNSYYGIKLEDTSNITLSGNNMIGCGLGIFGRKSQRSSHTIYTNNTVNGKPIYYYVDTIGLTAINFSNAGQVILVSCNSSTISYLNAYYTSIGIHLYNCDNNIISENYCINNSQYGIYLDLNCTNCLILDNTINKNLKMGILVNNHTSGNIIYKNIF
ncbi:MAG: hypothetical protein EU548_07555, partial [Promethearchaeota archaeon]